MRKVFELAKAYPIESVTLIGCEGFTVCCGADKFLEEWRWLAEPVMSRLVLPLPKSATIINSYNKGIYSCQNLDTLMLVNEESTQSVELSEGMICSRTVELGEHLAHITSGGLLKVYGVSVRN